MTLLPAAFLDRDGVINVDCDYVFRRQDFAYVPGIFDGARELRRLGFELVVVTNQSGIGRGLYTEAEFLELTRWVEARFASEGAPIAGTYFCPHHPTEAEGPYRIGCDCRKPMPGMLVAAAHDLDLDLATSVMFGDRLSDLEAARGAQVPLRVLLGTDGLEVPSSPLSELISIRSRSLDEVVFSDAFRQCLARQTSRMP